MGDIVLPILLSIAIGIANTSKISIFTDTFLAILYSRNFWPFFIHVFFGHIFASISNGI